MDQSHESCTDLDLDSTRIQVDALGHTSTPFWSVLSCHLHFLPDDSHPYSKSLLTVLLQFVRGRPGPLLNLGTSQCNACRGMRWWSIRITCPSWPCINYLLLTSLSISPGKPSQSWMPSPLQLLPEACWKQKKVKGRPTFLRSLIDRAMCTYLRIIIICTSHCFIYGYHELVNWLPCWLKWHGKLQKLWIKNDRK